MDISHYPVCHFFHSILETGSHEWWWYSDFGLLSLILDTGEKQTCELESPSVTLDLRHLSFVHLDSNLGAASSPQCSQCKGSWQHLLSCGTLPLAHGSVTIRSSAGSAVCQAVLWKESCLSLFVAFKNFALNGSWHFWSMSLLTLIHAESSNSYQVCLQNWQMKEGYSLNSRSAVGKTQVWSILKEITL